MATLVRLSGDIFCYSDDIHMAFSFSRLIISESDIRTTKESFSLTKDKDFQMEKLGTAACLGKINECDVWLGFKKGVPAWRCSCKKLGSPCSHVIAIALIWDRNRNVPDPSMEDVVDLTNYKVSLKPNSFL
jgi:hypothetical protein